jgi:hypothetical protein
LFIFSFALGLRITFQQPLSACSFPGILEFLAAVFSGDALENEKSAATGAPLKIEHATAPLTKRAIEASRLKNAD